MVSFAVVAAAADLNRTHATNPRWVGHARFHVVWQVITHIGVGLLALVLTWAPVGDLRVRLAVAMAIAGVVLGGFFLSAATMRCYDGELADPNGYRPLTARVGGRRVVVDKNVLLFLGGSAPLVAALALFALAKGV
ncbi:hypothetical protein BJP25_23845 [Actinokineospora bangkokensis]|uniref:Uncharacterized protein n=1 Tax=Actinokineospora bangkokensis TaxID=1193682 RepID=A0A1Q9LJ07_9PSEU|nr:hypothetical protein BJP25_23845 [Actinokineospora bangkokensis]